MAMPRKKVRSGGLGVSSPISIAGPNAHDLRSSEALEMSIRMYSDVGAEPVAGEMPQLGTQWEAVVSELQQLVSTWVHACAIKHGIGDVQAAETRCKLLTLGSQALGAALLGADIDLLAVVLEPSVPFLRFWRRPLALSLIMLFCSMVRDLDPIHFSP